MKNTNRYSRSRNVVEKENYKGQLDYGVARISTTKPMRSQEAADYLGISRNTLYNEVSMGRIRRRKFGRRNMYFKEELDQVLKMRDEE